jgi:hypothetical protein
MRFRPARWNLPLLLAFAGCTLLAAALLNSSARAQEPVPGHSAVIIPERSDAGYWHGTWYHLSRDFTLALWLRSVDGQVQAKLQFVSSTPTAERFTTDWEGLAEYHLERFPATFELKLLESDDDTILGTWDWLLQLPAASGREEHARFTIYRIGDGRQLVVLYDDYEIIRRSGNTVRRYDGARFRMFNKASNRLVLWDELPF